jgi:nitrogen-specific signal transduction histidine kinase
MSLKKLLENFNASTDSLKRSYADLEAKFTNINTELEKKNIDLERSVSEKEEIKNYLQNILESLTDGVIVTDIEGKVQRLNRSAGIFAEIEEGDAKGKHIWVVLDIPETEQKKGSSFSEYLSMLDKNKIKLKGRSIEIFSSLLATRNNEASGNVLVLHDVTRVERLEEMAKRSEKFALMAAMAAYIAEEIRNPLGSIELFTGLLMKDVTGKKDRQRLEQIETAVRRMDYKIANLLMFTQTRVPDMVRVDINEMLKEALSFAEYIASQGNIAIDCRFTESEPNVIGDVEMLKQLFLNIILNSIQAMPEGGKLQIETKVFQESSAAGAAAYYLEIVFKDNGAGIPEANMPKIFDPFFSTKEGRSGLGLTIVHNIVQLHKGTVHIEGAERGGTLVTVLLPYDVRPH